MSKIPEEMVAGPGENKKEIKRATLVDSFHGKEDNKATNKYLFRGNFYEDHRNVLRYKERNTAKN